MWLSRYPSKQHCCIPSKRDRLSFSPATAPLTVSTALNNKAMSTSCWMSLPRQNISLEFVYFKDRQYLAYIIISLAAVNSQLSVGVFRLFDDNHSILRANVLNSTLHWFCNLTFRRVRAPGETSPGSRFSALHYTRAVLKTRASSRFQLSLIQNCAQPASECWEQSGVPIAVVTICAPRKGLVWSKATNNVCMNEHYGRVINLLWPLRVTRHHWLPTITNNVKQETEGEQIQSRHKPFPDKECIVDGN